MTIAPRGATADYYRERILRVLVHIQQHLDDALDLDSLAALAHFSPFHFHRIFRGMVGEGVKEHVRRLRLERAAHELRFGEEQIVRIAFGAGYETHESFTRAFSAMFGAAPSEFRKRRQPVEYPAAGVHFAADGRVVLQTRTGDKTMNVQIESRRGVRVAFVRNVGAYAGAGQAWEKLFTWAGRHGLMMGPVKIFGLAYDDPEVTPEEKLRYDACLEVGPKVQPEGDVGVQELEGGDFATAVHEGSYAKLGETYDALLGGWLPRSGRKPGPPPAIQEYLNDPRTTPEAQLRTKIWLRLG